MPILKKLQQHKVLLDAHVWIWLMTGEKDLSKQFLDSIPLIGGRKEAN